MNGFPQFDLTGQVALVTGVARGLGRAISLALAKAGAHIALGLRDVRAGGNLAREIKGMGRRPLPLQMNVTRLEQIFRAVDDAVAHFDRLDIHVNNAGLAPDNPAENVREEDFDLTLAVNLEGTFFASQAARRVMIRQRYGRIINLSSQADFVVAADGIGLLHEQGGHCTPDALLGGRVGKVRYYYERRSAYVHLHAGDRRGAGRPGISRRCR